MKHKHPLFAFLVLPAVSLLLFTSLAIKTPVAAATGDLTGKYGCMWNKNPAGLDELRNGGSASISATIFLDFDAGIVRTHTVGVHHFGTAEAGFYSARANATFTQELGDSEYEHYVTTTVTEATRSVGDTTRWHLLSVNGGNTLLGVAHIEAGTTTALTKLNSVDLRTMVCQKV